MRKPPSEERTAFEEEGFASVHENIRNDGFTGTVETVYDGGGAVFLNGAAVYARHGDEAAEEALGSLRSDDESRVRASVSTPEAVRMFRTYLRYIGDDALLTVEPLDGAEVDAHAVEGVTVEGVSDTMSTPAQRDGGANTNQFLTRASVSVKASTPERSVFPEGRRTALAPDGEALSRHVSRAGVTGYAAGDGAVVTFVDGDLVDRKRVDIRPSVREDVGVCSGKGWVVVDADADAEAKKEASGEEEGGNGEEADEADQGILGRIL